MKKISVILAISLLSITSGYSQYFQGTFTNTGNTLVFKMKPSATVPTSIAYMEFCFRYNTGSAPGFSISNLVNGAQFPGINIQRRSDYVSGPYTYVRFVHNTSTITSFTYDPGTEYEICRMNLIGAGVGNFEMASDLNDPNFETVFGVVDGSANFIDPGANDQFYGPGFNIVGSTHLLPLGNVPIPVKFTGFTAIKKDDNAVLNWKVENESAVTDIYEIERSFNGRDFVKIADVAVKPIISGNITNSYEFTDYNVKSLRSDILYYRIKQVDKDSKFAYTEIKSIRLDGKQFSANVFPNPVISTGNVNIDLVADENISILLTDAAGKELKKQVIAGKTGLNVFKLNMAALASGTYQVRVIAGSESKVISVIKK